MISEKSTEREKGIDYSTCRLSVKELLLTGGKTLILTGGISYLFYDSLLGMLVTPLVFYFLLRMERGKVIRLRQQKLEEGFLDFLKSLAAALPAGYSIENAWKESQKEMALLHGKESDIYREIAAMNQAVTMNIPMEEALNSFARRAGLEDIYEFAEVFRFAKRSGGNFVNIINSTALRISGKYETKKEIEVLVAAKQLEQKVMNVIPLFILAYLKLTDGEYMSVLYGNIFGVLFMSLCLAAYAGAIFLSRNVLNIEV